LKHYTRQAVVKLMPVKPRTPSLLMVENDGLAKSCGQYLSIALV